MELHSPPLLYYPDFYPDPTWLRSILLLTEGITRIVPRDVVLDDPESLREIAGDLGALTKIAPTENHLSPFGNSFEWLNRALALIGRGSCLNKEGGVRISISPSGSSVEFRDRVLLYDGKVSDIVRCLLEQNGLIDHAAQRLSDNLCGREGAIIVRKEAANAVLSFIADSIARDLGYTTITNEPLDFAMNSLTGFEVPIHAPAGASEGMLASAFASVLVPREVGQIRFSDYKLLRQYSSDLRVAFGAFVQKCHDSCRLDRTESTATLQQQVLDTAKTIEREFEKFQRVTSRALSFVRDWWPIGISGLIYCAKDFVPPEIALSTQGASAATLGIKFFEKVFKISTDENKKAVFNLAAELGTNILALPRVSQLLEESTRCRGQTTL